MTSLQTSTPAVRELRWLKPIIALAILIVLLRYLMPVVVPSTSMIGALGGLFGTLLILLWWLFFSRAPWFERIGVLALMVVAVFVTWRFVHQSIAGGMMGMMLPMYAIIPLGLALVAGVLAGRGRSAAGRWASMLVAIAVACGPFTLLRTDGITGGGGSQITWRWTPTAEERLLAKSDDTPAPQPPAPAPSPAPTTQEVSKEQPPTKPAGERSTVPVPPAVAASPASPVAMPKPDWPGFRGPERDGVIHGVRIDTDWSASPPAKLWSRPIGPGWSSFAVRGDLLYTQEQRGNDEIVACYKVSTGAPVWRHRDPVRFWESNGGAGPRGTPTIDNDRVYALGATGVLNALDALTGAVVWSRNAAADTATKTPGWGFSGSPLVVGDVVIVATSGKLVGYDIATGKPRWTGPAHLTSYSSPHLVTLDGVMQVLLLTGSGATSVAPADGKVLWEHEWAGGGATIVQPAILPNGDILINSIAMTGGLGIRRLSVKRGAGGWSLEERWTSLGLKPYFNDFVVHKGHAFGFDGSILAAINLDDGSRVWKGGRYGSGQVVLLSEQDVLLVVSEEGELALVSATPDGFKEIAKVPGIEGKTWNHPVLVRDVLLVRNGEEMAAFRMPLAGR
jgi:outer membrane protein assembly factor BamB